MKKSSAYPPLDGLLDLACRDGVDIRPTLLRVLTDLYVQKPTHSAEEEAQYVELALGLIEAVDAPTRAAAIASLSAYPGAPAIVLRKLTGSQSPDGGDDTVSTDTKTGDLVEVFFAAGAEERRLILINLDVGAVTAPRRPAAASSEVIRRLEAAALQRNAGEFSRMLERALGISRAGGADHARSVRRAGRGRRPRPRHDRRRLAARLAVPQSGDRPIDRSGPRTRAPVR